MQWKKLMKSFILAACSVCLLTACGNTENSSNHLFVLKGTPVTEDSTFVENNVLSGELTASASSSAAESDGTYGESITVAESNTVAQDTPETSESISVAEEITTTAEGLHISEESAASEETIVSQHGNSSQGEGASSPSRPPVSEASSPSQAPANETTANTDPGKGILYSAHGALSVQNGSLADAHGNPFQVYGMSTHGLAWFPQYVNYDAFQTLRDDWNTNCVRLAMYSAEYNGYCTGGDKEQLKTLVKSGVEYATALDMYVIIDWHVLGDQDPNVYKEEAKAFFEEMSSTYADYDNVIYEICNEPNGYATWDSVKNYANEVIPIIRNNDSNAIIIVGTPTWSQNIDQAAASPLDYDNVLYALHFYAGTHKDDLRSRLETCVQNGLPVIVSEFGMCDASGNGGNDFDSTSKWMELIEQYNLSFFCWNLANKNESSSVFNSSSQTTSNWTENDLSESGKWIREYFREKSK